MIFFIVRPMRLDFRTQAICAKIRAVMDKHALEHKIEISEYPGHATLLAKQAAAQGAKCVVACGGDGTIHEVAGALMHSDTPMGVLPIGTGNDFVRTLNIPKNLESALNIVLSHNVKRIDMGTVLDRPFINVAGIGFDAEVVATADNLKRLNLNGPLAYKVSTLLTLFTLKYNDLTVTVDGVSKNLRALFIAAANGRMIGGGMCVAPKAQLDDGLFDVCIVKALSKLTIIRLLPTFIKGRHIELDICEYIRASTIEVSANNIINLQLDGELMRSKTATFQIHPGALSIIAP